MKPTTRAVLAYLRQNRSLTQEEAREHLRNWRLAAAIYDLRQARYEITTTRLPTRNGGTFARYTLIGEPT